MKKVAIFVSMLALLANVVMVWGSFAHDIFYIIQLLLIFVSALAYLKKDKKLSLIFAFLLALIFVPAVSLYYSIGSKKHFSRVFNETFDKTENLCISGQVCPEHLEGMQLVDKHLGIYSKNINCGLFEAELKYSTQNGKKGFLLILDYGLSKTMKVYKPEDI